MDAAGSARSPAGGLGHPRSWRFGPYRFDRANGILSRNEDELYLPPRAAGVLENLLLHAGDVVSKDDLVADVWHESAVTDQSPAEAVRVIRDVLGDDARHARYVQTVHRRGYRFIAEVHEDEPAATDEVPVAAAPSALEIATARAARWGSLTVLLFAGVALGVLGTLIASPWAKRDAAPPIAPRVTLALSHSLVPSTPPALAISPDGRSLVYRAEVDGRDMFYLQSLVEFDERRLPGTEGGFGPFFSPDGQWVGFFRERALFKISVRSGTPILIARTPPGTAGGASWGGDGTIVFARGQRAALWSVPAAGGVPQPIAQPRLDAGEYAYLWPELLPGDRTMVFSIAPVGVASSEDCRLAVLSLDDGSIRVLRVNGGVLPRYLDSGHLAFVRGGTVVAVPFDGATGRTSGHVEPLIEDLLMVRGGAAQVAVSRQGTIAYAPGGAPDRHLAWIDRQGVSEALDMAPGPYGRHRLSPDGGTVALAIAGDIWLYEIERGTSQRFTAHDADEMTPLWNPLGNTMLFASNRSGPYDLYERKVDGTSEDRLLLGSDHHKIPDGWSPDGRWLVYTEVHPETGLDVWLLEARSGNEPVALLRSRFDESQASFSRDGRHLAYVSNESGTYEVFVTRMSGGGPRVQVSQGGGRSPVWSAAGDELFFNAGNRILSSRVLSTDPFTASAPVEAMRVPDTNSFFALSPDGTRFLVGISTAPNRPNRIRLVADGTSLLRDTTGNP